MHSRELLAILYNLESFLPVCLPRFVGLSLRHDLLKNFLLFILADHLNLKVLLLGEVQLLIRVEVIRVNRVAVLGHCFRHISTLILLRCLIVDSLELLLDEVILDSQSVELHLLPIRVILGVTLLYNRVLSVHAFQN